MKNQITEESAGRFIEVLKLLSDKMDKLQAEVTTANENLNDLTRDPKNGV